MNMPSKAPASAPTEGRLFFNKKTVPPKIRKRSDAAPAAAAKVYRDGQCEVHKEPSAETIARLHAEPGLLWLNIDGSHIVDVNGVEQPSPWLEAIGELFHFHALAMEDVRNRKQRAKLDRFDDGSSLPHLFIVARIPDGSDPGETEQISIFLREDLVVTIQESPGGDCLSHARKVARGASQRGTLSASLLVAEILDAAVMDYMAHLPGPENVIEELGNTIGTAKTDGLVYKFHHFRIEALHLLRDLRPLEAVLTVLATTTDDPLLRPAARAKFKDALDHQQRAVDTLDHLADESKELMNLTLAMASHKMNEVMQVLTIISAIFIPPTLIAGIYGMNFQHMPELAWQHGYFYVLMVIACITAVQLGMFWWKDWLVLPNIMSRLTPPFLEERKAQRRRRSP